MFFLYVIITICILKTECSSNRNQNSGQVFFDDNVPNNANTQFSYLNNPVYIPNPLSSNINYPTYAPLPITPRNSAHASNPLASNLNYPTYAPNPLSSITKNPTKLPNFQSKKVNNPIQNTQQGDVGSLNLEQVQPITESVNTNDSYLQGLYANQQNSNQNTPNQNPGGIQQPSTKLEPPVDKEGHVDYYGVQQSSQISSGSQPAPAQDDSEIIPAVQHQVDDYTLAISDFGFSVMKKIKRATSSNVVVSPYSIASLLALLQQGALGETQEQISKALGMSPEKAATTFKTLFDDVKKRGSERNILRIGTNIFAADAFELNKSYKRFAVSNFGSEVTSTNFGNPIVASHRINSWVKSKTNNRIEKLVNPEDLSVNTQVVLANAVFFKGLWQNMFRPEATITKEFNLSNGITKMVPFMRMRRIFKAGLDSKNGAQSIVLPFENEQYSLIVIQPASPTRVDDVLSSLTGLDLVSYINFAPMEVELELPKFTIRDDVDLNPILREMGVTNIFGQKSELSNLGTYRNYSPQISSALHTAMMSIDEKGATAAAASAFAVVALSNDNPSLVFKVDRPFIAVLWDNKSNVPLFIAKIEDPTS